MILEISLRITSEIDLFLLGVTGMKMHKGMVEVCISNNRNPTEATNELLRRYITDHHHNDRRAAYTGLCAALRHKEVKLTYLIKEVLEKTETEEGKEGKGEHKCTRRVSNSFQRCINFSSTKTPGKFSSDLYQWRI